MTADRGFCVDPHQRALVLQLPTIFNTDLAVQFACDGFTSVSTSAGADISIDGRRRVLDNVFVERLLRSVKDGEWHLKDHETVPIVRRGLDRKSGFHTHVRLRQALDCRARAAVYAEGVSAGSRTRRRWPPDGASAHATSGQTTTISTSNTVLTTVSSSGGGRSRTRK